MPFKSTAQQRYMYSQHPEIASRWTEEMRSSRRKGAKQHPIKSADLPRHVGKRMTGGSFESGPSAVVRGVSRAPVRRNKVSRYGGSPGHGSRRAEPGVEVYHANSPRSRVAKAGSGPSFTPTNAMPRPKPLAPPPPTPAPTSAGDGRPGTLVPTGGSSAAPTAGAATGGATASSAPTTGAIGAAANMTAQPKRQVGQRGPAQVTKADTMSVRLHGASGRSYDPEGQRQRRLGAGMAAASGGGAAALVSGGRELHRLNSRTKAVMRDAGAASESIRHTAVVSRRSAGKVAGGLVGLATANKIRHHANDPSNRKWD